MNQINGYNISDPIGGNVGGGGDPIGLGITQGTPDAAAPIGGGGVMPAPAPARVAADMGMQSVGIPDMSVLPPTTLSQKLIQAGMGMIAADRHGVGLGGAMGAGMNAFNQTQLDYNDLMMKRRQQQLQDYQLMGQIADRHNTELAMQRKLQAGVQFKNAYPELAAMYDADPSEATKMVAEYYKTNGKSPLTGEADNSLLSGDEYLKTLDPKRANQIKAIATGKYPLNKRASSYNKDMQDVLAYDPNANEQTIKMRNDAASDYSSKGASGRILTSTATAASHLADLKEAYAALHNGNWNGVNFVKNAYASTHSGDRHIALNKANLAIDTIAPELDRIASGTDPTISGTKSRKDKFNLNDDPASFAASLNEAGSLIKGKTDSLVENYQRLMGQKEAPETLKPFSEKVLGSFKDLGVDLSTVNDRIKPAALVPDAPVAPAALVPSAPANALPSPKTKAEYDALPAGLYVAPDGTTKRKK